MKTRNKKSKYLYMVVDNSNEFELPVFVGTADEVALKEGVSRSTIYSAISNAQKLGNNCRYVKITDD